MCCLRLKVENQVEQLASTPPCQQAPALPASNKPIPPLPLTQRIVSLADPCADGEHSQVFERDTEPVVGVNGGHK